MTERRAEEGRVERESRAERERATGKRAVEKGGEETATGEGGRRPATEEF